MNNAQFQAAIDALQALVPDARPRWALVLGSGWGVVADAFPARREIAYADIPGLGNTQVQGHAGRLLIAPLGGADLLIFQGRRHWYEGVGWQPLALPTVLSAALGVTTMVLTNAAGGIRADLRPGDLMVIDDHINAMGANPLIGPHDPRWGARFPDMSAVYAPALRAAFDAAAQTAASPVKHGVYLATSGPTYETPAEIRAFRTLGADAVGMSTVPEAILAHAAGMRVAGLSCITNLAAGVSQTPLSHAEVIAESQRAQSRMRALLVEFFKILAKDLAGAGKP
jgi:purine-nucleoside phosphorylase